MVLFEVSGNSFIEKVCDINTIEEGKQIAHEKLMNQVEDKGFIYTQFSIYDGDRVINLHWKVVDSEMVERESRWI